MKKSLKIFFLTLGITSIFLAGCYTQLMTPQDYIKSRNTHPVVQMDMSSEINYSNNCLSCHSRSELDDRYYDMQTYGVVSAHGFRIDPSMWIATNLPVYEPPYFPDSPGAPVSPWWLPPPVIVTGSAGSDQRNNTNPPQKRRADNPSRGTDNTTRQRDSSPSTYAPPSSGTSTSPTVNTGAPAASVSSPPQSQPQNSGSRERGSSSSSPAPTKKRSD